MKITNLLSVFTLIRSRSIFPQPRPTTLGYHPDYPNVLIPVPLFPIEPAITEEIKVKPISTENDIPEPATTFEPTTTQKLTTEKASFEKELTTTTSTAVPFYTTFSKEISESLTATIPFSQETSNSKTVVRIPVTSEIPATSTPFTSQSNPENDQGIGLRDGFVAAWEMAKDFGAIVMDGVGGMFSKITSLFN